MNYLETLIKMIKATEIIVAGKSTVYEKGLSEIEKQIESAKRKNKKLFFIGNGGSAGVALHMSADFQKSAEIRTQTFFDSPLMTCMSNDYGYEQSFSKPLEINADKNDILIAISSSGESKNILNAVAKAKELGCKVFTFSGFKKDNSLSVMGDINIYVPIEHYGIVESIHNLILQQIIDDIKEKENGE
ncbi:MAG: SIS domain-containing protein [Lachnospiraceae bacterium]|nr:SIS domain-containing protein [Lachnospiraceae bacterium]